MRNAFYKCSINRALAIFYLDNRHQLIKMRIFSKQDVLCTSRTLSVRDANKKQSGIFGMVVYLINPRTNPSPGFNFVQDDEQNTKGGNTTLETFLS